MGNDCDICGDSEDVKYYPEMDLYVCNGCIFDMDSGEIRE